MRIADVGGPGDQKMARESCLGFASPKTAPFAKLRHMRLPPPRLQFARERWTPLEGRSVAVDCPMPRICAPAWDSPPMVD